MADWIFLKNRVYSYKIYKPIDMNEIHNIYNKPKNNKPNTNIDNNLPNKNNNDINDNIIKNNVKGSCYYIYHKYNNRYNMFSTLLKKLIYNIYETNIHNNITIYS